MGENSEEERIDWQEIFPEFMKKHISDEKEKKLMIEFFEISIRTTGNDIDKTQFAELYKKYYKVNTSDKK